MSSPVSLDGGGKLSEMNIASERGAIDETYSQFRRRIHSWVLVIRQTTLGDPLSTRHRWPPSTPPAHTYTSNGTIKIFTSRSVVVAVVVGDDSRQAAPSGTDVRHATPRRRQLPQRSLRLLAGVLRHSGVRSRLSRDVIVTSLYNCVTVSG